MMAQVRLYTRCFMAGFLVLLAGAALAKPGTPGPEYFAGSYEMVGRSAGVPALQNGPAQIIAQGSDVVIRSCFAPDLVMGFGPSFEAVNLMTGSQSGDAVECLFHNSGFNRPILTCRSGGGGAFSLWPIARADLPC